MNIATNALKAILFDVGYTLNRPRSGHWFIPPNISAFFGQELSTMYAEDVLNAALKKAYAYLDANHHVETEEQEYEQFKEYYRILLQTLQYPAVTDTLLANLSHDMVHNDEKYIFFDDVFIVLPVLRRHFLLGIVSDTWPSLERVFINCDLRHYFSTFIISSKLGVCKPHPTMYQSALEDLKILPHEALFIDDGVQNVEGAYSLGIRSVLIDRKNTSETPDNFPTISDLYDLMKLLGISNYR